MARRLTPALAVLVAMLSLLLAGGAGLSPASADEGDPAPTTTELDVTQTPTPAKKGSVTVEVTSDGGDGTPSGEVRMVLTDDSGWTGRTIAATLDDTGAATTALPKLNAGDYTLTADYQGDATHAPSTAEESLTVAEEKQDECDDGDGDPTTFKVCDAVFRWGVNDESNNRGFAPGTFNFLSAGAVPNPGRGGATIGNDATWTTTKQVAWRARQGNVRIEKNTASGPQLATFAGLRTGPKGESIPSPTSGIFSNHQVVISGGTGKVDPKKGTATITWTGSFGIVYYSGMTYFNVTNPTLEVTSTSARITAVASGFGTDMDDMTKWERLPDTKVVLADLGKVGPQKLRAPKGFTAAGKYLKVKYGPPGGGTPQVRSESHWGSFPKSYVDFQARTGQLSYWYSSGGSTDRFKVAKPVTVSWDAQQAIEPDKPPTNATPVDEQPTNNPGSVPPGDQPPGPSLPTSDQPAGPTLPSQQLDSRTALPTGSTMPSGYEPPVSYALSSASTSSARPDDGSNHAWEWAVGFLLLLGAAGITVFNPLMHRLKGTR